MAGAHATNVVRGMGPAKQVFDGATSTSVLQFYRACQAGSLWRRQATGTDFVMLAVHNEILVAPPEAQLVQRVAAPEDAANSGNIAASNFEVISCGGFGVGSFACGENGGVRDVEGAMGIVTVFDAERARPLRAAASVELDRFEAKWVLSARRRKRFLLRALFAKLGIAESGARAAGRHATERNETVQGVSFGAEVGDRFRARGVRLFGRREFERVGVRRKFSGAATHTTHSSTRSEPQAHWAIEGAKGPAR